MPPLRFAIKKGDLLPELGATLKDADGVVVDLTAATAAEFHMTPVGSATPKVNSAMTFVSKPAGTVKYTWIASDTDTVGDFYAEIEVTWGTKTETFPNNDHIQVRVLEELA